MCENFPLNSIDFRLKSQEFCEFQVFSFMAWRNPNVRWARWRPGHSEGDMHGRAIFKLDGTLRSEIERSVQVRSTKMMVF